MKIVLSILVGVLVSAALGIIIAGWWVSKPIFDEVMDGDLINLVEMAPAEVAVTFARTLQGEVVLVTATTSTGIEGQIVPGRDGVEVFNQIGFAGAELLRQDTISNKPSEFTWQQLGIPVETTYPHIAAGTNFRAHAEEVGMQDGEPFLFPKLSPATSWNAPVAQGARLDYEVELCAVTLDNHTTSKPSKLGYVLCGDFTERWALITGLDLDLPMGTTGFPEGKGGPTRLPIGPLLVIPKDADTFYRDLELSLYVNGGLRQRDKAGLMIWSPSVIANKALNGCKMNYYRAKETLNLTSCAAVPAKTLILTGTPEGVGFHLANLWSAAFYLNPGDEVVGVATYLGVTRNLVEGGKN